MSTPQTNFENNNNRLANYAKNIDNILGYVLLYSVIIFTTISALLGGTVIYPFYLIIYILNKTKETKATKANEIAEANEIADDKNPIIDETWCNVSVKNIINYTNEVVEEEEEVLSLKKPLSEYESESEEDEEEEQNEIEVEDNSPNDKYSCHYKPELIDFNN
jgi:hypothetical protein